MQIDSSRFGARCALACALAALFSCNGGGGGGSRDAFAIAALNLEAGATWPINRAIEIRFTRPVDPASVSLDSILVNELGGGPVAGEFTLDGDGMTVVFQPRCPTLGDLSDSGFAFGPHPVTSGPHIYELSVLGGGAPGNVSVRSTNGEALAFGATRAFTTPLVTNTAGLFFDPKPGPARPRLLGDADTDETNATRIEIGADAQKHYFRRVNGALELDPPVELPLNGFAELATRVAFVIELDQPIDPSAVNLGSQRVRLEFRDAQGAWRTLQTKAALVVNCSRSGATLRLEPLGLLPAGTSVRAVLSPQFTDLVGETTLAAQDDFAVAPTIPFPSSLSDVFTEGFDDAALEDTTSVFAEPAADWSDGALRAKFAFGGTGGPDGTFDWKIAPGQIVILNTLQSNITGGPNFQATGFQTVLDGIVDVRDLWIDTGGVLKAEGPNPLVIRASGSVRIDGTIVLNGTSSSGVVTLGTTNTQESGAPGQAGGGRGGTGHPVTTAPCPRGGNGAGAFNVPDGGGQGGETGWTTAFGVDARRGGGGGGGRFGPNVPNISTGIGAFDQSRIGLDAEPGFASAATNGAFTGAAGPFGGAVGMSPFVDNNTHNDFFGVMFDDIAGAVIPGELSKPWAGEGGGGGGDGVQLVSGSFPGPSVLNGYQKGAGGGGGGGAMHVLALGNIVFGTTGRILCRGGLGGGGENSVAGGYARIGGGSGGGSGGHVILESSAHIDFSALASNAIAIMATGGQGGAGKGDFGGAQLTANGQSETQPNQDACPFGYPASGTNACLGFIDGAGGDGGPGMIQLHTSTGVVGVAGSGADIVLPNGATLRSLCRPPALCVGGAGVDCHMLPSFGRLSHARSKWIALGEGGYDVATASQRDIAFAFAGIDPNSGAIATDANGRVLGESAVLNAGPIVFAPALPHIVTPGAQTLVLDGNVLLGTPHEELLAHTALLVHYALELFDLGDPSDYLRFDVVAASYDASAGTLSLTVDGDGPPLTAFAALAGVGVAVRPTYFRVRTDGIADELPTSAAVHVMLEATSADAHGQPDLTAATGFTADVALINTIPNGALRFVRFDVLFDIDVHGLGLTASSPIPSLEFVRLPFRY